MRPQPFWSTVAPIGLAVALAIAVLASNEWSHRAASQAQASVAERIRARVTTEMLLRRVVDAETAQRGYLLTGRAEYLEPYRNAEADIHRALAVVRAQHEREPAALATVDELTRHARGRLTELATTLALHDAGDHAGWQFVLVTGQGRATMQALRQAAGTLLESEDRRIEEERRVIDRMLDRGRLAVHATTLLALIWLIFFLRKNRALQRAQRDHAQDLKGQRDALEQQVLSRTEELRELNAHLQDIREVERGTLSRLLHDELGALLTAAKLDLTRLRRSLPPLSADSADRLQHLSSALDDGVALKRRIMEELSPSALHNLGLRPALEFLVSDFRQRSGVDVSIDVDDVILADAPRIVVYRLVQECLNNLEQHAAAPSARVVVHQVEQQLMVQVCDSGKGFDPAQVPPTRHGLRQLRHRIESLGGRMRVVSAPGQGTQIEARLPLGAAAA